jgi:ABC-type multidrug transport system fused ATPase/permease subunit
MSAITVDGVLKKHMPDFDEEVLSYITSILEEMTLDERKSQQNLLEVIGPFIVDTGYADQAGSEALCKTISVAFGGSGYKAKSSSNTAAADDVPMLLSAPIKIIDHAPSLKPVKATYGGAVLADASEDDSAPGIQLSNNSLMDASSIPTTQKQLRKMRKENEQLQKILKAEAAARAALAAELAHARMAAIRASRAGGRQSLTGVNIERLSLPHPSGTGELLSDATLILAPGRRYGLVGRNGAGALYLPVTGT